MIRQSLEKKRDGEIIGKEREKKVKAYPVNKEA